MITIYDITSYAIQYSHQVQPSDVYSVEFMMMRTPRDLLRFIDYNKNTGLDTFTAAINTTAMVESAQKALAIQQEYYLDILTELRGLGSDWAEPLPLTGWGVKALQRYATDESFMHFMSHSAPAAVATGSVPDVDLLSNIKCKLTCLDEVLALAIDDAISVVAPTAMQGGAVAVSSVYGLDHEISLWIVDRINEILSPAHA